MAKRRSFSSAVLSCSFGLVLAACGGGDSESEAGSETANNTNTGTTAGETETTSTETTTTATTSPSGSDSDSDNTTVGPTTDPTTGPTTDPTTGPTTDPTTGPTTDPTTGPTTDPTDATTDPTDATTDPTDATTDPTDATTDDPSTTTGDPEPCEPGDTDGMMGMVENSYLWVANTDQASIAKIDTLDIVELARYRSGPTNENNASPSRTAVSADGRFVVVNNRGTARITMIAANEGDCFDKNNDNTITTSQNPNDILAWNTEDDWVDECIIWSTKLPAAPGDFGAGPRGVTWNIGTWNYDTCTYEDPKIFVGYRPQANVAHMAVLNSATGVIEDTVIINPWNVGNNNWGPYGAALDAEQNVWFTGLRGNVYKIDGNDLSVQTWAPPGNAQFYGMTVDGEGRTWTGGCSGPVYRFDPMDETFTAVPGTQACHRGVAADREGHIWVASNGPCGVAEVDADTATLVEFHNLAPCSTPVGVSVDTEGFVWVVDQSQGAWKIDPINPVDKTFLPVSNTHYTYSDMTGGQLRSVLPQ